MEKKRRDSAAEWKRASGVWQNWAEKHWNESDQNPFAQPRAQDPGVESAGVDTPVDPDLKQGTP